MILKWYGQSFFQITVSQNKGEKINIITNPFTKKSGLKIPSLKPDIILVGQEDNDFKISGDSFLINTPGEYEIKSVFVHGIQEVGTVFYAIEAEKIRLAYLAGLSKQELSDDQIAKLGEIDILMIPVGAVEFADAVLAQKVVNQIEPRLVIPMNYQIPKLKTKLDKVDEFLKLMGQTSTEAQEKLVIKKKDLTEEETKIIVLKS
jgi:L-ascorbate metabolism protein UlaG (beta-lactamase superfamily)